MHPILFHLPLPGLGPIPIYTWGVMLGLSLIVGWYLTLGLAERDGLPREMLANNYVITALAALVGARALFVLTNLDQFENFGAIFELRSGGMVAYGGFLGGLAGSLAYLGFKRFPLLPWADVAVPSLASGLLLTRVGCYLYGCDFGTRLSDTSPALLQKLGTFPHWTTGPLAEVGSPAFRHHVALEWVSPEASHALAVHPTQLYEALFGAGLLVLLLWMRKEQRFRGQIFLTFAIVYGAGRFLLELVRDDAERGSVPPAMAQHLLLPLSLLALGAAIIAFVLPALKSSVIRVPIAVASVGVPAGFFIAMKPAEFVPSTSVSLSSSQFIALTSGVLACWGFGLLAKTGGREAMTPVIWKDDSEPLVDQEEMAKPSPPKKKSKTDEASRKPEAGAAKLEAAADVEQAESVSIRPSKSKVKASSKSPAGKSEKKKPKATPKDEP